MSFTDPNEFAERYGVPAPPVHDTAVALTMYPTVHSFRTSGGVIATGAA